MKSIKKFSIILLLAIIAAAVLLISACSKVNAAPKSKIVGTYQLTRYERSRSSDGADPVNLIERDGIVCYLVVAENGNGYYAYKDNNTAAYVLGAKIEFKADEDDASKFEYVVYSTEKDSSSTSLGYDHDVLNKSRPVFKGQLFQGTLEVDYTLYTEFKKVSKAQDMSYINAHMQNAAVYNYGEYLYSGYFNKNFIEYPSVLVDFAQADIYAYYFVKLDPIANKAKLFYMLKSDMVRKTETVDYTTELGTNEFGGEMLKLTIGTKTAEINGPFTNSHNRAFPLSYSFTIDERVYYASVNLNYNSDINDENIDEYIESEIGGLQSA